MPRVLSIFSHRAAAQIGLERPTRYVVTRAWGRVSSRGTHSMSKRDDYLDNTHDKSHLADLAERWLDLADRTQRRPTHSAHRIEEHLLVKRAFRYFRA